MIAQISAPSVDQDGRRSDIDDLFDVPSILEHEFKTFIANKCPVDCNVLERCEPGAQAVDWRNLPLIDAFKGIDVAAMGGLVEKTGWKKSVSCPWFQIARQALLLEEIESRHRTKQDKLAALKEFAALPGVDAFFTNNRCNSFLYKKRCLEFFRQYPVLLLMWGNDMTRTHVHYRKLLSVKKQMQEMIQSDPLIESFFKGRTCCFFVLL